MAKRKKKNKKRYKREQRTYSFSTSIEIERTYTGNYGAPGKKRAKKEKPTEEQIEKQNQYNREKLIRRILKENYTEDDYWVLLTYLKGYRTDIKAAKKDFSRFVRMLRREYRKKGYELKWVVRTDVGKKGAAHHHLVANRIPDGDAIIKKCWRKITGAGFPSYTPMYEEGGFQGLAHYITKPPEEEGIERNYSRSRNLSIPEPEVTRALKKEMREYPKAMPGYYIDPDSVHMGTNPITGNEYQHFIMYKIGYSPLKLEFAETGEPDQGGGG